MNGEMWVFGGRPVGALIVGLLLCVSSALAEGPKAGFDPKQGGFFLADESGDNKLVIQARVQTRLEWNVLEGSDGIAFSVPRARLTLKGRVFDPRLTFKFQTDFGKGSVALKDFYADWRFVKGWLHFRVGQWKRPFSRQQINSSGALNFVDRAITDKGFKAGRDIGIAFHNNYEKSPGFEWALGLFNGTGDKGQFTGSGFTNVPRRFLPALVARVGFNHGGIKGYTEPDLKGGPLRFAIGASTVANFDVSENDTASVYGGLDLALKAHGFSANAAAYVSAIGNAISAVEFDALGGHVEAGYVIAGVAQPMLRYAAIDPDGADNLVQEASVGLNIFAFGHGLKWVTDGSVLLTEGKDTAYRLRTQIQLGF
ncbi:MAG: hypothetical protein ACI9OJ_000727 [Myxococcota bacterium]|jgi:hypothetical protein